MLLLALASGSLWTINSAAAERPARQARVSQGQQVPLASSKLEPAELKSARPQMDALKPRVRTNTE
jgi:hypothetical protein